MRSPLCLVALLLPGLAACDAPAGPAPEFYAATFHCPAEAHAAVEEEARRIAKRRDLRFATAGYDRAGSHMLLRLFREGDDAVLVSGFEPNWPERRTGDERQRLYVSASSWDESRGPALRAVAQDLHKALLAICGGG